MENMEIEPDNMMLYQGETKMKYVPDVEEDLKPKVDQQFDSLDAVYKFYNDYAWKAGFSVRKSQDTKKKKIVVWKSYVCFKQGETDETWRKKNEAEVRRRRDTRTWCNAKLTVSLDGNHYVVKTFIEEHNHPPTTPIRVHMLPSHRKGGGHDNVGCIERDLRNAVRDEREHVKGHDVDILHEHFKAEQAKDPDFFFCFDTNEEQRLVRCFWVDSMAKKAYSHFGDVVVFDTTYNTNRYKMIFAPFVGVNHHGQTTVFGCAFLSDETFDSFVWLLNTWLAAMPRGPPNVIITDQDQAMSKAITQVLPNTITPDLNETPIIKLGMPMEIQMAHLFTRKYFQYFQVQLHDSNGYFVDIVYEDDVRSVYKTKRVFAKSLRMRTLVHDKISSMVTCSCKMFEFEGIPCRHILALLRLKQIMELPKNYILRRWTRFSRVRKETCQSQDGDSSLIMRHTNMFKIASDIIDEAAISYEGYEMVIKSFEGLREKIKKLNLSAGQSITKNVVAEGSQENRFLDPIQAKTKGSGKRLISWRDKKGKAKHFSICRSTKHTRNTCTSVSSRVVEDGGESALGEQDQSVDEI